MRTKAIIKIVIWSFVVVILTSLLCGLLNNRSISGWFFGSYYKPGTENYNVGNVNTADLIGEDAVDVSTIKNISIDWINGDVKIVASDDSQIHITESSIDNLDDSSKLRWNISGNTLDIIFKKSTRNVFEPNIKSKSLEVKIPAVVLSSLESFKFNGVSAELIASGITANSINIDTVSGDITMTSSSTKSLRTGSVSAKIIFGVVNGTANCDTVSGDVELTLLDASKINFDAVSASLVVYIPTDKTFSISLDSISGKDNNIDADIYKNKVTANAQIIIDAETVSGNVYIKKSA